MLLLWHCSLSLFVVGLWRGHVLMICSMLYGAVRQYPHGFLLPFLSLGHEGII